MNIERSDFMSELLYAGPFPPLPLQMLLLLAEIFVGLEKGNIDFSPKSRDPFVDGRRFWLRESLNETTYSISVRVLSVST